MERGILYLCPTPLGNLEDVTLRALRILRDVSVIAAEDTRHTRKLLSHFDIHTPLVSYHEHNKTVKIPVMIDRLLQGESVALVSDAGTPGIADPGEELVREAVRSEIPVVALPGPVAAVTALSASGLPASEFLFLGFLPARGTKKSALINRAVEVESTVIFYEAPHRLEKTLEALAQCCPERQLAVARELTKIHEEYVRGTVADVLRHFVQNPPRGEITVVMHGKEQEPPPAADPATLVERLMADGLTKKEAVKEAAKRLGVPRNDIYKLFVK